MVGNGNRLKGSQLGYYGKGPPALGTLLALQDMHAAAALARGLPPQASSNTMVCKSL